MQMFFNMKNTAARGRNDVIKTIKIVKEQIVAALGKVFKTGVSHGLTTTGLIGRIDNFTAKFFQQFQGGDAYLRIKLVYITGYK